MIVGIQESFIDYPNQICIMLFTKTCSWDCPGCYNKKNLLNAEPLSIDYVKNYLLQSKDFTSYVTISGGEPTEDLDIVWLVKWLYDNGFHIKLDTNGSNVRVLKQLLRYLDVVAMDIKVSPSDFSLYYNLTKTLFDQFTSVQESIKLLSSWYSENPEYRILIFRTTLFTDYIDTDQIKNYLHENSIEYSDYIIQDDIRSKSGR